MATKTAQFQRKEYDNEFMNALDDAFDAFIVVARNKETGEVKVEQHNEAKWARRATGRLRFEEGFDYAFVAGAQLSKLFWDNDNETYYIVEEEEDGS